MTAIQFPMFTEPIPPANPTMWGEHLLPPTPPGPPVAVPPQILAFSATPVAGGNCDFECTTDVPCTGILEWGTDGVTFPNAVPAAAGNGQAAPLTWSLSGFTPASTYSYRFVVTGQSPPNDVQTVGSIETFVAI